MRGIKGTKKDIGQPCAMCRQPLTKEIAVHRRPPRFGLLSYCRPCLNKRAVMKNKENPERRRQADKRRRDALKDQVMKGYGGMCECCGERTPEFLAVDHRNGGGSLHRRTVTSPTEIRRLIIREGFPKTYRLLCHNCNGAIGWFGRCPHQLH